MTTGPSTLLMISWLGTVIERLPVAVVSLKNISFGTEDRVTTATRTAIAAQVFQNLPRVVMRPARSTVIYRKKAVIARK